VEAILAGAFQRISAHLAVDAIGGKFWQLMLAERALQVGRDFNFFSPHAQPNLISLTPAAE
jgi:hypothetical protein